MLKIVGDKRTRANTGAREFMDLSQDRRSQTGVCQEGLGERGGTTSSRGAKGDERQRQYDPNKGAEVWVEYLRKSFACKKCTF